MNKVKEILNLLAEWQTKWWWRVLRIFATLAMAIIAVSVALYYCNYTSEDKTTILKYLAYSILAVTVIYLAWQRWENEEYFEWWLAIVIITAIVVFGAWDAYYCNCFVGEGKPITLNYLVGSIGAIVTMYLFLRRVKNQEEQTQIQTRQLNRETGKEIDDRFTTAVNSLGSDQTSVRTVAIYSLHQHAIDYEKYRKRIAQILCSHIRSKTQEENYQKDHKTRPSNEIQTTIDLLFREIENKGLYPQFRQELPNANLSHAYCVGADFKRAYCQDANFVGAHFQGAHFERANCQGAKFWGTHCEGVYFTQTYCDGADFKEAHCQGANFLGNDFEETDFWRANCQGANLGIIHHRGAQFGETRCEGACSDIELILLEDRIGKDTALEPVWEGTLLEEEKHDLPDGIISGVLEDNAELQKIIKLLNEIEVS